MKPSSAEGMTTYRVWLTAELLFNGDMLAGRGERRIAKR
jgi:hypothetical protein